MWLYYSSQIIVVLSEQVFPVEMQTTQQQAIYCSRTKKLKLAMDKTDDVMIPELTAESDTDSYSDNWH